MNKHFQVSGPNLTPMAQQRKAKVTILLVNTIGPEMLTNHNSIPSTLAYTEMALKRDFLVNELHCVMHIFCTQIPHLMSSLYLVPLIKKF